MNATVAARRMLLPAAGICFVLAAWFSHTFVLETAVLDLTIPKVALLGTAVVLLLARPWRLVQRVDIATFALLGLLAGWLLLVGLLRGDMLDVRRTAGALLFGTLALGVTWAALRTRPIRGARALAWFIFGFTVVSFGAAAVELATYRIGQPDPLAWLWEIFRPQRVVFDERFGVTYPPLQLHWYSGDMLLRVSGFSWHANILALSMLAPAAFGSMCVAFSIRVGRRRLAIVGLLTLALATAAIIWTHSRAGLIGLAGVVVVTAIFLLVADRSRRRALVVATPLIAGVLLIGTFVALDRAGLERLAGTIQDPGKGQQEVPTPAQDASDLADVRWRMVSAAARLISESPTTLLIGPGLGAYTNAVNDVEGPLYIVEAYNVPDPSSFWVTMSLAGGLTATALILGAIALAWWRLVQRWRDGPNEGVSWYRIHLGWLIVGLPVWVAVQNAGGSPLEVPEAIPFGALLGVAIAFGAKPGTAPDSARDMARG
ncbi:MAG TPA: O-antigen ligase family protein [Candidatus Limnocylindrales bacterium]|nr:O-antigen ligase family protein [Candidatus Limnocylindrales bacterium]